MFTEEFSSFQEEIREVVALNDAGSVSSGRPHGAWGEGKHQRPYMVWKNKWSGVQKSCVNLPASQVFLAGRGFAETPQPLAVC